MPVGLTTALVMGGLAAAGSIGGAAINAHAAGKASDTQAAAADQIGADAKVAADKAATSVTDATKTANQTLTDAQQKQLDALAPYIKSGQISLDQLNQLFGPDGPLASPSSQFSFTSKDFDSNDPGYQFIRDQARQQVMREAAAHGTALGGGTEKALGRYESGLASTHLDAAFNRTLSTYQTNRQNLIQRITGLQNITGLGFGAVGQQDADIGNTATGIARNTMFAGEYAGDTGLKASQIAAEALAGKANAQAAGDVATGNAWSSGISGVANGLSAALGYKKPASVPLYSRAPGTGFDPNYDPITGAPINTGSTLHV